MDKVKQELDGMTFAQLAEKIAVLRQELFGLRLNVSTAHIKDYSQFKKLRRALAQALTYFRQHQDLVKYQYK